MLKALPTKFFSTVRPKKSKENRDTPLLSIKVFEVPKILKQKGIPYRALQGAYVKKVNGEKWYHPLRHEIFRKPNFFDIPKCSPKKIFGNLRQKIFDWKSWYSVLLHKFSRYLTSETVRNIRWFLTKFFATVRQKNRGKTVICNEVSKIPNILNLRSRSQEFFAYCETKHFEWRTWFSVLMHRKIR